ncbi:e3 ubiquitin-protein ligase RFWD3 [Caerostris darwini]|uniref:E3 ubiquitin-protein ligase RFWD3 n=1 Tax=Caerostris darwini TaxID=1538125 RepID=A0AAV4QP70_9ARAC|nr:e3 ubiquitin-protein ligase RFWD3 [Caerostris darwini]
MERNPHDDSDEEELVDIVTAPESDHSYAESDIDVIYVEDEGAPMDTYVAELVPLEPNRESSLSHPSVINLTPSHPQPIGEDEVMPSLITDIAESNEQSNQSVNEDDGQTCTICFEPWTNSNEHRLVSLRCGHLFGRSCITRWLKGQARCPQCNARARKSEIRNIYAKSVKVIDTLERDKALEELQKERQTKEISN